MPPICRSYHEKRSDSNWTTSELIMEWICYPIFDADDHAYDTSSVVHLRSSPDLTPDAILLRLFRNAHHPDSLSAQLTVVWWLLPEAATGGPSSISIAVTSRPTLLSCHTRSGMLRHSLPLDAFAPPTPLWFGCFTCILFVGFFTTISLSDFLRA